MDGIRSQKGPENWWAKDGHRWSQMDHPHYPNLPSGNLT